MIAIDSNVLVRLLVRDDPQQFEIAQALFGSRLTAAAPGYVSLVVLAETYWVLSKTYKFDAARIRAILLEVLDSEQLVFERPDIVTQACVERFADFSDGLIHLLGCDVGCERTVTFDRKFARQSGVELLA